MDGDFHREAQYRQAPTNSEAEQALLAAILVNNAAYHRVSEFLKPEHFSLGVHARIFGAAAKMIDTGSVANPVTLKNLFEQDDALQEVGGAQYLSRLAASVVTIINAEDYGRTIHDLFLRRQLIEIGEDIVNDANTVSLDSAGATIARAAEQRLYEVMSPTESKDSLVDSGTTALRAIERAEKARKGGRAVGTLLTGIDKLDHIIGGIEPAQLIVVAGRPSMGKTALASGIEGWAAKQFIAEAARDGTKAKTALEFELEMSAEQMAGRRLAAITKIPLYKMKQGQLDQSDFDSLLAARERLGRLPIFTDDTPNLSVADIRARCRRFLRKGPIGLIMVDHIGLVKPPEIRNGNRVAEITAITAGLKNLAKEFGVPVLALCQLSRGVEQRDDKRPMLSDLRDSGSIEQDADIVLFVYREEYYLRRSEPVQRPEETDLKFQERFSQWQARVNDTAGQADIIVAKQRDGDVGTARCAFDGAVTLFKNLTDNIDQGDLAL